MVTVLKPETSKITTKKVGPDKKNRARKNEKKYTMFWPFRTTGHSRFGWGSHRRWSPTRLKKMSYGQKTVMGNFSENLKMLFLKNTHKPWIFDNKIFLTGRWQYLQTKNQPCSSVGGRAMNSGVPKNHNFRLWGGGRGSVLFKNPRKKNAFFEKMTRTSKLQLFIPQLMWCWQYLYTKNHPGSSFGGRAMTSGVPKNHNFRLWGGDGCPLLIP